MRRTRGFTLIELLVVLVIVGVISAVSMPLLGDALGGGAQMRQEARQVMTLLRMARMLAMSDKEVRGVEFDPENRLIRFRGEIPPEMDEVQREIRLPQGERLQAWASGGDVPAVQDEQTFDPEGDNLPLIEFNRMGVSSGIEVRLIRQSFVLRLSCDPLTGETSVREDVEE